MTNYDDDSSFRERWSLSICVGLVVLGMGTVFASTAVSVVARIAAALP
jgi:hypothetical protein